MSKTQQKLLDELRKARQGMVSFQPGNNMERRRGLEQIILDASMHLVGSHAKEIDSVIQNLLVQVGQLTDLDRCYLFLFSEDGSSKRITHEWCAPGRESQAQDLHNLAVNNYSWLMEPLARFENVFIPQIAAMPSEAHTAQDAFLLSGIKSLIAIPLVSSPSLLGFAGFESYRKELDWQEEDIQLLRIAVDILSNRLIHKQAEELLQEHTLFVSSLLRAIPVAVFYKDRDGKYIGCNDAFTEIMGVSSEQVRGKMVFELWPSEMAQVYHQKDLEMIDTQQHQIYEFQVKDKHGNIRPVIFAKDVFMDANGQVAGIVGAFLDISERKHWEDTLLESEKRYRLLAENTSDVIWTMDLNFRSTYTSPAVWRLRGFQVDDARDQPLEKALTPASLQLAVRVLQEELGRDGLDGVDPHRSRTLELEVIRKDGSIVWAEATITFIRDPDGKPVEILGVSRDISERRRAETVLRDSEERYRTLIEQSNDAIYLLSSEKFELINPRFCEMFGVTQEDACKPEFSLMSLIAPESQPFIQARKQLFESGKNLPSRYEFTALDRSGNPIEVELSTSYIMYRGDRAVQGILRDITERKRAERLLKRKITGINALARISQSLLADLDCEKSVQEALQLLGETFDVHRVYLFKNHVERASDRLIMSHMMEWCQPEITRQIDNPDLLSIAYDSIDPGVFEALSCGKPYMMNVCDMDADARALLEPQEIFTILLVPIMVNQFFWGYIGFDSCYQNKMWDESDVNILRAVANSIGTAMHRKESEERFRTLANNIPGVVYLCRNDERYSMIYLNQAVEQITGYSISDFLEDRVSFVDLYHPDDREGIILAVDEALKRHEVFHLVYRLRRADGAWRYVEERGTGVFDGQDLRFMEGFLADITERKEAENALKQASQELASAYDATLQGWSNALELREQETAGHSQRVVDLASRLAVRMGIQGEALLHFRRGALLHDIGKMGIPDNILLKPGPLTSDEWGIMRQHPQYAYNLLSIIPYLEPALDIPYCHHEKWDGTGYPRRLKGEEIPLAARVFAVVDVWDALLNARPYRPAWSKDSVIGYLKQETGQHFDPRVVNSFLEIVDQQA